MPIEPQAEQQTSSLYRRHRPRTFDAVVGQDPVVRTLRNAVERHRVHHAYLFVGSRGTGKTSMAKILAACLNCERGPTVDPCGVCDSCVSIARASSLDVIEMDAASNNSVEDIRELRDSVAFAPVSGRRKVYILDEAHMLSQAAWNAFLKTLEEPPPDTVFVLATTEAQKVPATVVDRCHRFDFQRPTVEQLAQVLERTAQEEGIEIPREAIAAIARSATGSFRDALGTLEQLLAYSGATIALGDVLAVLGVPEDELLERTIDAVAAGDSRAALLALAESAQAGRDAHSLASGLQARARELMIVQTLGEVPLELALTPEHDERLAAQAERVSHAVAVRLLELIGEARESARAGTDERTSLELALVKAARPEVDASTRALLARLERLERLEGEGGSMASATAAPERIATEPAVGDPSDPEPAASHAPAGEPAASHPPAPEPAASEATAAARPEARSSAPDPMAAAGSPPVTVAELEGMIDLWPAVVELVGAGHALCGAVIADARPVGVADGDVTVGFPAGAAFLKKKAEDPANRAIVTEALRELTGARWRISYELREELAADADEQPTVYSEQEWIERFKDELDAEEIPVDPDEREQQAERPADREAVRAASGEARARERKEA